MDDVLKNIRVRASRDLKQIVFPEFEDDRIVRAVNCIDDLAIAKPVLLTPDKVDAKLVDKFGEYIFERKRRKGLTPQDARKLAGEPLHYGAMMCRMGMADGFVAGAANKTSSVVRAALDCLSLDTFGLISSCFVMQIPQCGYGEDGLFVYADCAVIPHPDTDQLAAIALASAKFTRDILNITPRVAFLSFSTRGSAQDESLKKIRRAVAIAQADPNNFCVDGELQVDAAIVEDVAKRKLSDSPVAGKANVLIFSNLDTGNICYKLTERLARGRAVGPLILGTLEPCSDLSRGCSVDDVIDCAAVTAVRAQRR